MFRLLAGWTKKYLFESAKVFRGKPIIRSFGTLVLTLNIYLRRVRNLRGKLPLEKIVSPGLKEGKSKIYVTTLTELFPIKRDTFRTQISYSKRIRLKLIVKLPILLIFGFVLFFL